MRAFDGLPPVASRRDVLAAGLAGGFLLAFHLPVRAANEPEQRPDTSAGQFAPNAFIRIDHAGKITLIMPQVEMGQGVYTAIADDPRRRTRCRFQPRVRSSRRRRTTSSTAIRSSGSRSPAIPIPSAPSGSRLRKAGAAARAMLIAGRGGDSGRSIRRAVQRRQRQGHPRGERARAGLWRARRRGAATVRPRRSAAQGPEGFHAHRQAAEAARHARQSRRHGASTASTRCCPA